MAVRRLPMVDDSAQLERPRTLGDCRSGPRPCPWVSCRSNLLIDVLADGSLVLNAPSSRVKGAERTIAPKHDFDAHAVWFVEVRLYPRRQAKNRTPQIFALGPCGSAPRARQLAASWQQIAGRNTTRIHKRLPPEMQPVGARREGGIDAKFLDEAEDAVNHWFDEPDPNMPSCIHDEVAKLADAKQTTDDDGALLEQIAKVMYVSRERVRQVEAEALPAFRSGLEESGLSIADLLEER